MDGILNHHGLCCDPFCSMVGSMEPEDPISKLILPVLSVLLRYYCTSCSQHRALIFLFMWPLLNAEKEIMCNAFVSPYSVCDYCNFFFLPSNGNANLFCLFASAFQLIQHNSVTKGHLLYTKHTRPVTHKHVHPYTHTDPQTTIPSP